MTTAQFPMMEELLLVPHEQRELLVLAAFSAGVLCVLAVCLFVRFGWRSLDAWCVLALAVTAGVVTSRVF